MKILMFFHGGSLNRGCEAIVRSAAALLKEQFPKCEIALASRDPQSDRHIPNVDVIYHDYRRTIKKFSWEWLNAVIRLRLFKDEKYIHKCVHQPLLSLIPSFDVFLSIGGDNYCYGEQPGVYVVDEEIKKQGKRLILWGASIGEEDLSPAKLKDLRIFDAVLAREPLTYSILTNAGLTNVHRVADGAFLMSREDLPLPEGWVEGSVIGLNYSPLVQKKNPASYQAFNDLIQYLLGKTDLTIALTPHVTERGNDDHSVLSEFYERYRATGRVLLLPDNLNAIQYKGFIARMRYFIGARTHATIAAYSTGVPTLVLGYSVKSKGISKDLFGEEVLVLGLQELSSIERVQQKVDELFRREDELRATLQARLPEVREMAASAAKYVG